jgi:hypothetical protein
VTDRRITNSFNYRVNVCAIRDVGPREAPIWIVKLWQTCRLARTQRMGKRLDGAVLLVWKTKQVEGFGMHQLLHMHID